MWSTGLSSTQFILTTTGARVPTLGCDLGILPLGLVNLSLDQFLPDVALVEAVVIGLVEVAPGLAIALRIARAIASTNLGKSVWVAMG